MNDLDIKAEIAFIDPENNRPHVIISENAFYGILEGLWHGSDCSFLVLLNYLDETITDLIFKDLTVEDLINEGLFYAALMYGGLIDAEDDDELRSWFIFECQNRWQLLEIVKLFDFSNLQIVSDPEIQLLKTNDARGTQKIFVHEKALYRILAGCTEYCHNLQELCELLERSINNALPKDGLSTNFCLQCRDPLGLMGKIKKMKFKYLEIFPE